MAEEQSEAAAAAALILKIVNAEGLKDMRFLGKMKSFVVAWVDPRFKRSSKTLTTTSTSPNWYYQLSFPLTLQTLQNPNNSCITIQILSPSSPIHRERVIGSTILPLTDILRYVSEEMMFTLQLWRPSGRAQGLLRVSSRIEYYYTSNNQLQHSSSSSSAAADVASSYPQLDCGVVVVTGIPVVHSNSLFLDETAVSGTTTTHVVPVPVPVPSAPPLMSPTTEQVQTQTTPMQVPVQMPEESNVLRSVLIGFLGGAVAVATVLIGGGGRNY